MATVTVAPSDRVRTMRDMDQLPLRKKLLPPGIVWLWMLYMSYALLALDGIAAALDVWSWFLFAVAMVPMAYVFGALWVQWFIERHAIREYQHEAREREGIVKR